MIEKSIIVVIGLGSMGQRRIRLIKENFSYEVIGYDEKEERKTNAKNKFQIKILDRLEDLQNYNNIKCIFSCISPSKHFEIIKLAHELLIPVFSELNLVLDNYDHIIKIEESAKIKIFNSSTMLYRKEIKRIIEFNNNTKLIYSYQVGQYLPDWHPWESYKDFFVNNISTNAIREILAIELPWLVMAFGEIVDFKVITNKISDLEIEYPDAIHLIIKHEKGTSGYLGIDLLSRKAIRNFRAHNDENIIKWSGTPQSYAEYDLKSKDYIYLFDKMKSIHNNDYAEFIIEDAYLEEIKAFFKFIDDNVQPHYSFKKHQSILTFIDQIEFLDS